MPKQNQMSNERSKVRILFVEGDFAAGDLHELTQTLTNAIKPAPSFLRGALSVRPAASAVIAPADTNGAMNTAEAEVESLDEDLGADMHAETGRAAKGTAKPRNYRKPQPIDMDMASNGKPFKEFAAAKGATTHRAKYLVAAAWLHDFAKIETITADHVFTCYKTAGWNFDVTDPTVTFRQLKKEGLGVLKHGKFSVNHLGLAEVVDMNAPAKG